MSVGLQNLDTEGVPSRTMRTLAWTETSRGGSDAVIRRLTLPVLDSEESPSF